MNDHRRASVLLINIRNIRIFVGKKPINLRTADVSPRSSPMRNVSRGGTSSTQRQKFHTDDEKSVRNPVRSATVNSRLADTPMIRTVAKSPAKTNYRGLTEINSRYYGHSLMRTLTRGPHSVRYKGS